MTMNKGDRIGLALVGLVALGGAAWVVHKLQDETSRQSEPVVDAGDSESRPIPESAPRDEPADVAISAAPALPAGSEWTLRNGQGIAALQAGEIAAAVEHFEACLAAEPDEAVFQGNLAEALARLARERYAERDSRDDAIALLARATELAPDRADLARLLARWRKTAETENGYWTDESEHFSLSFDGTRTELMHGTGPLVVELESAYQDYGELFGRFPIEAGAPKIEVVLYRRAEFRELTGLGHWAGGAFDGVVRIPVEDLARERHALALTARHELVHAYVAAMDAGSIPAWLNEGLAQWLAVPEAGGRALAVQRAREALADGTYFPLSALQTTIAAWDNDDDIRRAYAQSLAFVAYIQQWYGERVLFEMVTGAGDGKPVVESFRARAGVDLDAALTDFGGGLAR